MLFSLPLEFRFCFYPLHSYHFLFSFLSLSFPCSGNGWVHLGPRLAKITIQSAARLAQSVERKPLILVVVGKSPTVGVISSTVFPFVFFWWWARWCWLRWWSVMMTMTLMAMLDLIFAMRKKTFGLCIKTCSLIPFWISAKPFWDMNETVWNILNKETP